MKYNLNIQEIDTWNKENPDKDIDDASESESSESEDD